MPRLIKLLAGAYAWAEDHFTALADEDPVPAGDVILSLTRFMAEGEALGANRSVGVRLKSDEKIEDLAYDLTRLPVIALEIPRFRDMRALTAARLLRDRYGYKGEIRAVGDVLREQAQHMVRCGFDAFLPADGADPQAWATAAARYRHVYQRAADHREPVFIERGGAE